MGPDGALRPPCAPRRGRSRRTGGAVLNVDVQDPRIDDSARAAVSQFGCAATGAVSRLDFHNVGLTCSPRDIDYEKIDPACGEGSTERDTRTLRCKGCDGVSHACKAETSGLRGTDVAAVLSWLRNSPSPRGKVLATRSASQELHGARVGVQVLVVESLRRRVGHEAPVDRGCDLSPLFAHAHTQEDEDEDEDEDWRRVLPFRRWRRFSTPPVVDRKFRSARPRRSGRACRRTNVNASSSA